MGLLLGSAPPLTKLHPDGRKRFRLGFRLAVVRAVGEGACWLVPSATFLNTDAIRPDFDPSAQWGCVVCGQTSHQPIRNREARVAEPHVA
jgi:hypothetical protein